MCGIANLRSHFADHAFRQYGAFSSPQSTRKMRRTLATREDVAEGVEKAEAEAAKARKRAAEIFMVAIQKYR